MRALARYWLPALAWMAVIWVLSSDAGSIERTAGLLVPLLTWLLPWATPGQIARIHGLMRKLGHLTEYAILAALWFRALHRERRLTSAASAWVALTASIAWAVLDEIHQATVPSRTASIADVMIDVTGAAFAVCAAHMRRQS